MTESFRPLCIQRGKMKLLLAIAFLAIGALAEEARFDNYRVHRLVPRTDDQLKAIHALIHGNEYNFWTEVSSVGEPVDVMVPPHKRSDFEELMSDLEMEQKISIENVQELIDEEKSNLRSRNRAMDWEAYHTFEEFDAWMDDLVKANKNVKKFVLGKTYEKKDIPGIEITFNAKNPTVFLESGIHAREWIAPAATSYVVNEILKSPEKSVWRKYNYIYVPFYNPDGYIYSWLKDRMWRKTRTPYKSGVKTCYGADPNRNWDFHWNEIGCSKDPCSETYAGPKAFSEVETKTLSEYLKANAKTKKIDLYLAFHSYSQLIMYPWGYTSSPTPHSSLWERIGKAAAKDLAAVNNVQFKVGDIYHTIYPSSGSSLEWYYGTFNNTIALVYELRDTGTYGFLLPPKFILPSGKELLASIERVVTEHQKLQKIY